jgi:hypothetical protein
MRMNVMNIMNMWKSAMFMPYLTETKDRMNVMNVARRFFACRARDVPKGFDATAGRKMRTSTHWSADGQWDQEDQGDR